LGLVRDLDVPSRLFEQVPVGRGEQQNGLLPMPNFPVPACQDGLIVTDQLDDVVPGDVVRGYDNDLRPVELGV